MSAIQSKAKGPSGKRTACYGRLSGGSMSCRSSELTRDDVITPARLRAFSPSDFEAYGARGEEFRRRLCGAVLHALKLSDAWRTDCESRGEWGGVFPVHLRLTHRTCKHVTLDILSPGAESPFWHGLIWIMPDHTGLYVLNSERFDPVAIRALLARAEEMIAAGVRPAEIAARLGRRGMH